MRYDATVGPNPGEWKSSDEAERLRAVRAHHAGDQADLPDVRLHAALHVVVENQIAEGHKAVLRALERLTAEGLDRHSAIHAISSVVARQMHALLKDAAAGFDAAAYARDLDALSASERA